MPRILVYNSRTITNFIAALCAATLLCPKEAFDPTPTFDKKEFQRSLQLYNWLTNKGELFDSSSSSLGLDFGVLRWGVERSHGWRFLLTRASLADSIALSALHERRVADLDSLIGNFKCPLIQMEPPAVVLI
ncbi:hypothetical protein EP47_05120 [Legionella norrlandica]|uniref:Uncharacterized protein n=1 Tax=Legionella norrlandica TaxID=1498499 RepID=A0A0A2SVI6_9GAMM|nr:hypothetical protein [Legionella norrlandica]KGP63746.1 hypothetical protein EP47_05120 [Legionella norrlandica]